MADYITIENPRTMYVPGRGSAELLPTEQALLGNVVNAAGTVMANRQESHVARSEDTALTNAFASLFYSLAYSIAGAAITGGLLLLLLFFIGGDEEVYMVVFFILWGLCLLGALAYNRWQGLWFSPAGLQHHEIDSRERIALHIVDRHIDLLEQKWQAKH